MKPVPATPAAKSHRNNAVLDTIRSHWQQLRDAEPGERFQELHQRRHQTGASGWQRGLRMLAAVGLTLIGLVMMPAPGPGMLVVLAGVALLAAESQSVARRLDRIELWVRGRLRRDRI